MHFPSSYAYIYTNTDRLTFINLNEDGNVDGKVEISDCLLKSVAYFSIYVSGSDK